MSWLLGWATGGSVGTLRISCERVLFVPVLATADGLRPPATLSGTVTLSLSRACDCDEIQVRLEGRATLTKDGASESFSTLDCGTTISAGGRLEPGEYSWPFTLEFPRTTAPSEDCTHGRIVHTLRARASSLKLTASSPILLVAVSHPADEPPRPVSISVAGSIPDMGPYEFSLTSDGAVVGGIVGTESSLRFGHQCVRQGRKTQLTRRACRSDTLIVRFCVRDPPCGSPC